MEIISPIDNDKVFRMCLGLFLIKRHESYRNVYGFTRVCERMFKIYFEENPIKSLVNYGMVSSVAVKGLDYYTITPQGEKFLSRYYPDALRKELLKRYPEKQEYIDSLCR